MISATKLYLLVVFSCFLMGCATNSNSNPLKPPSVYRDPKVHVTRAPTQIATDLPETDVSPSATVQPVWVQPQAAPTEDEQFLMNEIDTLLTKVENRLDTTDVNP
jgi:hypothetical protein